MGQQWFIQWCEDSANSKVFARIPSAPNELTVRRSMDQMICVNGQVRWKATATSTGRTDARKKIVSDHPIVLLSAAFSQRLV
jgi:hypothetical protein